MHRHELRVCIIGGGPSGLCSLRNVVASSCKIEAVLFEQQDDIGGVWNYGGGKVKLWDSNGNPMVFPMYSDLRCNLPKQLMELRDFQHKEKTDTFATQQDIHEYLVDYANHFRLWPSINLNSRVLSVQPLESGSWLVTTENTKTFEMSCHVFDAIMSCVGVNFYPKIPKVEGITTFKGLVMHSKYFKDVDEFRGKRIVLLGLGPSCADLCLKLSTVAKEVVACHRYPGGFSLGLLPPNARETVSVAKVKEWSVVTESGEEIPCDVFILCTGYQSFFPFLDPEVTFNSDLHPGEDSLNGELYKKMLVPKHPSFCFINAHGLAAEFLVMEIQAKYFVRCLEGAVTLPSSLAMEKAIAQSISSTKPTKKLTASLRGDGFALGHVSKYLLNLAKDAGLHEDFRHIVPLHLALFQWVIKRIFGSLAIYRRDELRVITPTLWEYKYKIMDPQDNGCCEATKVFQLKGDGTVVVISEVTH